MGSEGEHNFREDPLGLRRSPTRGEPVLASAGTSANRVDASASHTRLTAPAGCYTSQCTHDSCLELKINVAQAGSCESPPEARPRLLQSPWEWQGSALPGASPSLSNPRTQLQPSTNSTEPCSTGGILAPPWAQAHAQRWQVSAAPSADSSPGTKPGKSDAKPGWEWD